MVPGMGKKKHNANKKGEFTDFFNQLTPQSRMLRCMFSLCLKENCCIKVCFHSDIIHRASITKKLSSSVHLLAQCINTNEVKLKPDSTQLHLLTTILRGVKNI